MMNTQQDHRRTSRYKAERKISFNFAYDMETKLKFQKSGENKLTAYRRKYLGLSKNVSTEGLCFISGKKLKKGDRLNLEIYLPGDTQQIHMEGEVKWCDSVSAPIQQGNENLQFSTGVKLVSVEGKAVEDTIYFDEDYQVEWSTVLESILGKFRIMMQNKQKEKKGKA